MSHLPIVELSIVGIYDRGKPDKERIAIRVHADVNLNNFCMVRGIWSHQRKQLIPLHSFFFQFPDEEVEEGSWVIVYTGSGTNKRTTMKSTGAPALVLHWGLKNVAFSLPLVSVAVIEIGGVEIGPHP